ncbi:hypothetical protein [Pandoraea sp. PE-S2R-1]|uniref:hypothetical protein n=1 Tax=Pandoraea sp. PE-S2R-1 TaxID=1986994 RepID=UPI0011303981|nr:hypothetical protein [Pandoraea sp. PE-S2R-1]
MTDRELVEQAGVAAGYFPARVTDDGVVMLRGVPVNWRPLDDDGDALRLAIAIGILIDSAGTQYDLRDKVGSSYEHVTAIVNGKCFSEPIPSGGRLVAVRRAIVRAAASQAADERKS